jgi:hypothetical protein
MTDAPGLLTGVHPALERAIGPRISHPAVLEILSRCGGPTGIRKAGRRRLTAIATAHAPRLADSLKTVLQQRKHVAAEVEGILDAHPLAGS